MLANVVVKNLWKHYGPVGAICGVDLEIKSGEIFGLLGPNGSGKTTTVECLIGVRQPDHGEIEICGLDARRRPREAKEKIGVALQSTELQDKITPREALKLFGSFYRECRPPDVLLQEFGLVGKADARFETLSGGQRQRLAMALAFVNRPQLIVLDEPTTGLDPISRREVHAAIMQMKRNGCTVLLTTHQLGEAEQLCDRVAIIDHGRIVVTGAPRELIAGLNSMQVVVVTTAQPLDRLALEGLPDLFDLQTEGCTCRFKTANATQTLASLINLLRVQRGEMIDLRVGKASLEDLFFALAQGERGREALKGNG